MDLAEIRLATVGASRVAERLPVTGIIEPGGDRLVTVTPRVAGKIVSVSVVVGDAVRAGQTLAMLESTELARAQADYDHATIGLRLARSNLKRQKKLADLGTFSNPGLEQARREATEARAEVNASRGDVTTAENLIAEARSELSSWKSEVLQAESEVAAARSGVAEAESQLSALQAALAQAEAQVKVTQSAYARQQRLVDSGVSSRSQLEKAEAEHSRARADVDAALANIRQGQRKVETAEARVRSAQAGVSAAQGRVDRATTAIETAIAKKQQATARGQAAAKHAEIAEQRLGREEAVARGGYRTTKELVDAEGAVEEAEHEVEHSERAVRLLGGKPGDGTVIAVTAPIAGKIHQREVSVGETVDAGEGGGGRGDGPLRGRPAEGHGLFTIINLDLVWAQLSVAPADLARVRVGQKVELWTEGRGASDRGWGFGVQGSGSDRATPKSRLPTHNSNRVYRGTVSAIGTAVDETTRNVQVRCALENKDGALKPETFVRGEIITDVRENRLIVPDGAVQDHAGKPTVYVAKAGAPGGFEVRHVGVGMRGGSEDEWTSGGPNPRKRGRTERPIASTRPPNQWVEITRGLHPGEKIAVNGTFYLKSEAMKSSLSDGCCAVGGS